MADTIYALSSGKGRAGVAVIRVSGPFALSTAFALTGLRPIARKATLVVITDPASGELIDRGLAICFPGPGSFTGEDITEFHVHGGRAVILRLLSILSGMDDLRAAEPGEFTRRAFVNGKLDLTSAEGLADLIAADTELQRRHALKQLSGAASQSCSHWRRSLIEAQALLEAHLDFPDESEIPADVRPEVRKYLFALMQSLDEALASRRSAEIIRDGGVVLLAGPPNSGKSTLLNKIAARDVSIISELPGTTRDLIEVTIDLNGLPVVFVARAGLRDNEDPIEKQGIERTRSRAAGCHLVLWLAPSDQQICGPTLIHPNIHIIRTKRDLVDWRGDGLAVSATTGSGIPQLLQFVYETLAPAIETTESTILSTHRQFQCVDSALSLVRSALDQLDQGDLELSVEELREASRRLAEMTGVISNDDLLDDVFGRFCLGK